jgi:hypothetical protein
VVLDISANDSVTDVSVINETLNLILGQEKVRLVAQMPEPQTILEQNLYISPENVKIKLGTIHSVKGQTHNATLLFSDVYSNRSDFGWAGHNSTVYTPKFKKLIYVAASRPRQLFVVAISAEEYGKITGQSFFVGFEQVILN